MLAFRVISALLLSAYTSVGQADPPEHSQFFITASGERGNPVNVQTTDLVVTVDGRAASVDKVIPAGTLPITFAVVADVSGSQKDKQQFERKAIKDIFRKLSVGENRGFLVLFNDRVSIPNHPLSLKEVNQIVSNINFDGQTAIYDAVLATCKAPLLSGQRRAMIVISDGEDSASRARFETATACASQEGIPIFTLGLMGTDSPPRAKSVMEYLSKNTGGVAIILYEAENYERLFASIQDQYLVVVTSPAVVHGRATSLQVNSLNKKIQISAPSLLPAVPQTQNQISGASN